MQHKTIGEIISRNGNNLDIIRLFAAISVIVYHSLVLNPSWNLSDPIKGYFGYVTTGGLAVKVFFFISGLLVTNSILTRKSAYYFLVSRSLRVFPGLIFVVLITSLAIGPFLTSLPVREYFSSNELYNYILNNIILNTQYFLPDVLTGNKYGVNGSLWTIRYEVLAYITLLAIYLSGVGKYPLASSLICIAIMIEPITPFKGVLFAESENNAIYLLAPCFALGSLLAINKDSYKSNIAIPLFLFLIQFVIENEEVKSTLICFSVCLFSLHASSISLIKKLKINNDISYGVYLWGFPIQQIYSQNFNFGFLTNNTIAILTTAMFAYISWVMIEKPSMNIAKKLTTRPTLNLDIKSIHKQ